MLLEIDDVGRLEILAIQNLHCAVALQCRSTLLVDTAVSVDAAAAEILKALPWRVVQTIKRDHVRRFLDDRG